MITYCRKLFNHITAEIGANDVTLEFQDNDEIYYNHKTKTIVIGWQHLDNIVENGFKDWRSLQQIWIDNGYPFVVYGKMAVWAALIHELAHYVQSGKNHNDDYKDKLDTLIKWFAYDEVKDINGN